jgi:anaerobic magnesium-protoporphyrin IX monomethyl ester cyclase
VIGIKLKNGRGIRLTKKILFVIPPIENSILTAPYGILSIISYINKDNQYDIKVSTSNLIKTLVDFSPDYVGISVLFDSNFSYLKNIAPTIKENLPNCVLLVGGGLATSMYDMLLKEIPCIDFVCYGEGEIPIKRLLEGGSSPAWVTKESLRNNILPKHDFIEDLDEIPIINFDYIDLKKYNNRSPAMTPKIPNKVEMNIHTSRGCPFNCIFCSNGKIHGKKIRYMSMEKVEETINSYIKNGMNTLLIEDDNFLINKDRALKILDLVSKYKVNVIFPNGLSVRGINDDICKAFSKAKVEVIPLAIESGSNFVLREIMDKPLTKEEIPKAVALLRKYNIRVHAFIIIGLPNELDEHRLETLEFLINLGIDWVYIFIAIPITGSRLYDYCKEKGYLIGNFSDYNTSVCNIKAPGVNPTKIEEYRQHMIILINFVYNYNLLNKKYSVCLPYFLDASTKYDHAIANYMVSKVSKLLKGV